MAFFALTTVFAVSISSCNDDDDENNDPSALDSNRPTGGSVDEISATSSEAFYNILTSKGASVIIIDSRSANEFKAGHIKGAYSNPLTNDALYYDDDPIYTFVQDLDPNHKKTILLTDNVASELMLHVAGRISAMGWGKNKVYLLNGNTAKFLEEYPDLNGVQETL